MTAQQLEEGYWRAYRDFYQWGSIWRGAATHAQPRDRLRHLAYAVGWKKLEPAWDLLIRGRRVTYALPLLEQVLAAFGGRRPLPTGDRRAGPPPVPGDAAIPKPAATPTSLRQ